LLTPGGLTNKTIKQQYYKNNKYKKPTDMTKSDPLSECVTHAIKQYFEDLNGEMPSNLHNFFINEVEKPFLEVVMNQVNGNQTRAADMLGINRNTLRKKLKTYNLG
jgi:Fis family transcriptional regulator